MGRTFSLLSSVIGAGALLLGAGAQEIPTVADISFEASIFEEARLVSPFGMRTDPFRNRPSWHSGIDIHAAWDSPIRAPATGEVILADREPGYGKTIDLKISDKWTLRFAHLSTLSVEVGDKVDAGNVIGEVGSTGGNAEPHLHLEARHGDKRYDPVLLSGLQFFETEKPKN
ncbi:MAG: M23 family metallopeptidase [Henriciella sp.]|nr:M23 family metallopeptidase [Henriciella sp.]